MNDIIMLAGVFVLGTFAGFVVGAFIAAARDADDFDGGYRHDHEPAPPVRTIIWSRHIQQKDE